jgi:hypothetical protein
VLIEDDGTPLDLGSIRRRPTRAWSSGRTLNYRNCEVWLQLTRADLEVLTANPPPGWEQVITEVNHRLANSPGGAPNGDPRDRLPNAGLRRWLAIRDQNCCFCGCRIAAHNCQVDHTIDYAHGGPTLDWNTAPACPGDHDLKTNHGWTIEQSKPGHVTWTSPLGRTYTRRPPTRSECRTDPMPNPPRPKWEWAYLTYEDTNPGDEEMAFYKAFPTQPPTPPPAPKPTKPTRTFDDIPPF